MNTQESIDKIISLYKNGSHEEALRLCNSFLEDSIDHLVVTTYKCLCLKALKRYEEAIIILTECISKNPMEFYLWSFRGDCYFGVKDYDKAFGDYWTSLQLEENGAAYDDCARSLYLAGNQSHALIMIDKAVEKGENPEPILVMIEMLKRMGFKEGARQVVQKGKLKFPNDRRLAEIEI